MKTLRGRFIRSNLLSILISAVLALLVTGLLLFIFMHNNQYGFLRFLETIKKLSAGEPASGYHWALYVAFGIFLSMGAVLATCIAISRNISKAVLRPVEQLQQAAVNLSEGNLDFDILGCEDKELNDLCIAFEEIRKKLKVTAQQQMRGQQERNMLIANLSHDMRTPVTTIKGYVEGIRDGVAATPEKRQEYLDTIYNKALVLEKLLDSMTEYSELELGRMQYVFEYIDLNPYLSELAEEYQIDVASRGLNLEYQPSEVKLRIVGDRNKLKRVMDNLVSNAVKYNKQSGTVNLSLQSDGKGALICVSDTGGGIPKKDMNQVFDGFYRGDAARSDIKGNGLGLAISKQIVESHHGKIWIKSEENVGTTVFLYLPLRNQEMEHDAED